MIRMCSANGDRRSPPRGPGHKDGGWSRDPWHLSPDGQRTLCGRVATEYLKMDGPDVTVTAQAALEEDQLCRTCARKLEREHG